MNSEFKKISSILLLTFTFLFGVSEAFAAEKISTKSEVIQQEIEDPDLKLSIEELRTKYPASLLSEKNKKYKSGQKIKINNYSNAEIKAAFLNADRNFKARKDVKKTYFVKSDKTKSYHSGITDEVEVFNQQEILLIEEACEYLGGVDQSSLNKNLKTLQFFIFSSEKIKDHIYKFVTLRTQSCLLDNDPFERDYRD